ncbi:uncharacterized protein LOC136078408 [Hydra vulgaris]|uniref:Uncharacterized protein LOC136078408 n=1 Tax=Hydra vulgaris TaxID=6087 RepID=A0ABM4BMF0_HYDVU
MTPGKYTLSLCDNQNRKRIYLAGYKNLKSSKKRRKVLPGLSKESKDKYENFEGTMDDRRVDLELKVSKNGVAIFIKRDLVVNEVFDRHLREMLNSSNSEQLWCEIKIGNTIVFIGRVYRPPLSHINDINKTIMLAKQAVDRKAYSCMLLEAKKQLGNYLSATNWRLATLIRKYRKLRNKVPKACKRRVQVYEAQLASDKSNPKRVNAYSKTQQNVHASISADVLVSDAKGETLTVGIHLANRTNEHFKSVFVDDSKSSHLPIFERRHDREDLGNIIINFEATLAHLKGLKPNKSIGADNIIPKVLKERAAQMIYPLTLLYNKALSEGSTPTAWKQSHFTPLFKKGSRLNAANYRPVSTTSVPCKVMEKIISEKITKYLEKTRCILHNQHGFMSKKGCTSYSLESVDYITKPLSKINFVDIAFLKFVKAFDKVSHRRQLHKLKAFY